MVMMTPEQIRNLRVALGMTQQKLADAVGVNFSTVSCWESGKSHPTFKTMEKLNALAEAARAESAPKRHKELAKK